MQASAIGKMALRNEINGGAFDRGKKKNLKRTYRAEKGGLVREWLVCVRRRQDRICPWKGKAFHLDHSFLPKKRERYSSG